MADNVQSSDQIGSSGAVFATDDIGGIHYPISKITLGALDSVGTLLTGGAGAVDAGTLRVALASDAAVVDLGATDNAVLDAMAASLVTIDVDTGSIDGKITACDTGAVVIASGTLTANLGTIAGVATEATLATLDGKVTACNTGAVVLSSGTVTTVSTVTNLSQMGGVAISLNTGVRDTGTQRVTIATDDVVQIGDNSASLTVDVPAVASGGATPGKLISAATTNATSVKASAATVYSVQAFNTNAAARYLKIYNKASAPTVGTDVPVQVYTIPGNTAGAGLVVPIPSQGIALSTGFAFALTTGAADTDTGAVALNEIVVSYSYA